MAHRILYENWSLRVNILAIQKINFKWIWMFWWPHILHWISSRAAFKNFWKLYFLFYKQTPKVIVRNDACSILFRSQLSALSRSYFCPSYDEIPDTRVQSRQSWYKSIAIFLEIWGKYCEMERSQTISRSWRRRFVTKYLKAAKCENRFVVNNLSQTDACKNFPW